MIRVIYFNITAHQLSLDVLTYFTNLVKIKFTPSSVKIDFSTSSLGKFPFKEVILNEVYAVTITGRDFSKDKFD